MGIHTYAEPVKCKLEVWSGELDKKDYEQLSKHAPDWLKELYPSIRQAADGETSEKIFKGWTVDPWEDVGEISAIPLRKGRKTVFFINESEYESVGGVDATFFAKSLSSLKEFKKDFKISGCKIRSKAAVQWTT